MLRGSLALWAVRVLVKTSRSAMLSLIRTRKGARMGKWASYQKRGTARQFGVMAGPRAGDFSTSGITSSAVDVNRGANIPAPATAWQARAVRVTAPSGSIVQSTVGSGATLQITGLASGVQYRIEVAWWSATNLLSDWTIVGTITTL